MTRVTHNGIHIGNIYRTDNGWKAFSSLRSAWVGGPPLTFSHSTKRACSDWLHTIAENDVRDAAN